MSDDSGTPVFMPHNSLSEQELDVQYPRPRLTAPAEATGNDLLDDLQDSVYQKGLEIAREIQQHAVEHGRLRHAEQAAGRTTATTPIAPETTTRCSRTTSTAPPRTTSTAPARPPTTAPPRPTFPFEASASALFSVRSVAGGVFSRNASTALGLSRSGHARRQESFEIPMDPVCWFQHSNASVHNYPLE